MLDLRQIQYFRLRLRGGQFYARGAAAERGAAGAEHADSAAGETPRC